MTTTDPLELLAGWLPGVPGQAGFFPVMALASVDAAGDPDVRTVLLSALTPEGLCFHTDLRSRKVDQIRRRPAVALMLTIPERAGQIVISGAAVDQTEKDLMAAYQARSRYLQLLAWLNTADLADLPENERRRRWADFSQAHPDGTLQAPPEWTGFVVRPVRITFWQGHTDGPSHRTEYTRTHSGWNSVELPG